MSHSKNQKIINNHQLIEREQNYLHNRKLLTIHSEDRDINKCKQHRWMKVKENKDKD